MKTGNRGGQRRRRDLLELCAGAFLASGGAGVWPLAARAQHPAKVPRVGILSPAENAATPEIEAFRRGLRELGYVEGRNVTLEYRFAHGDYTALRRVAEELANLRVTEATARALGLAVIRVEAASLGALRALRPETLGGGGSPFFVLPDSMFRDHRSEVPALVATAGVPSIYPGREYADDGGLMSYGANVPDNFCRAADYVDRILRGARPGDLPIQRPVKFDFVVNLKTARELGLTVPPAILARADR